MNNIHKKLSNRFLYGKVISTKMNKTVIILVECRVKHVIYKKYISRFKKYYVHDEENKCRNGNLVKIKETKPISKTKSWVLLDIIKK